MSIRPPYTPEEIGRLRDQAYAEAMELRRQAMADFWRGANGLLVSAVHGAERSAARLSSRLRRRAAARSAAAANGA